MRKSRWRMSLLIASIGIVVSMLASVSLFNSSAAVQNKFASEGRSITPAGSLVMDTTTRRPAVGALPVDFVRSPDKSGPEGRGRYLIAVNSGFGVQFNSQTNRAQQSLAVIDLNARPPSVIQNVYFPSPQSVNVGVAFAQRAEQDGSFALYASGGKKTRSGCFSFDPAPTTQSRPALAGQTQRSKLRLSMSPGSRHRQTRRAITTTSRRFIRWDSRSARTATRCTSQTISGTASE